jgi:hypothetical protein
MEYGLTKKQFDRSKTNPNLFTPPSAFAGFLPGSGLCVFLLL